MVTYIRSDLDFILDQIKIAEEHSLYVAGIAGARPLFGPNGMIPANNISWGLRTVDGTLNNLIPGRETWGAADQPFPELLDPDYRTILVDHDNDPNTGPVPIDYTPGADNDGPGPAGPGDVFDPSVRTISNLIVDQTPGNPAALDKALERAGLSGSDYQDAYDAILAAYNTYLANGKTQFDLEAMQDTADMYGVAMQNDTLVILNVAPDEGLSASFNSWFTLFGQFFDHGLDLVAKGQSGTVFIPLQPDDPLYDPNSNTNFMVVTRATTAGPDGIMGTADDTRPVNLTTPFVDQNQTYTSHPSHQVFLREYEMVNGRPVATGEMLDGANGGLPTWAEVKAQAQAMLGIDLQDYHVGNLPLLATDPYGNFIPNAAGFPQVVMEPGNVLASGTPGAPLALVQITGPGPDDFVHLAVRTGHAFLDDIAHEAVPFGKIEDGDLTIGLANPGNGDIEYDNELLDAHFITGDGRGNENIGLTAVHHVFHAEHNRLVQHTKDVVLAENDLAFLNEWLAVDVAGLPTTQAAIDALQWDGERLFQAAKFGTEMQYQHLVFEEFARKIQPQIDVFLVPQGYDATINPAIVAEFAHVVYRFGHSMLTDSVDRYDPNFVPDHIGLIEGFLNPPEFLNGGTAEEAAGAIVRGMTRQPGSEIDEFVTGALRNNLLGLPLDLATINLARGRDTGVPSLNAARREFYEVTGGDSQLRPYDSWVDFAGNLKNPNSIVNFIAAYGLHDLITDESTLEGKRAAALAIILGADQTLSDGRTIVAPTDALDFLNSSGAWASTPAGVTTTGLDDVDLWVGGLAEQIMPFGGMLGSTFNFVFEVQMEQLQNADRFYYLQRLDGLHLFGEMENNSFAAMIMRNTDATHLPADVFSTPGLILEVDPAKQFNDLDGDGDLESGDPTGGTILTPLVIRNNPATPGADSNYLRYTGSEHVVLGGTDGDDILISSIGDDTLYGDGGDDRLEGGAGNDVINGGDGDDIITDLGGDDNIKGGDGNDVINGGNGANLILGGAGSDFIVAGADAASEVFAGTGNDFILGSRTTERILGNEGDDWIEVGTFDGAPGDNFDEIFAEDKVAGNDVFFGDGSTDEFIGEGGDDIMVGSAGVNKMEGMSGFDWATYKDEPMGVLADLLLNAFDETPPPPNQATLDQYGNVEGLSGSAHDDTLYGSDVTSVEMPTEGKRGSVLTAEGIARIAGLQEVVGVGVTSFDGGNIILGGDGDDTIIGRGGDDIIDGDKWLNVRISVRQNNDGTGPEIQSHDSMTTLVAQMFAGTLNPGQLQIVREILTADGTGDIDTAVYAGNMADYTVVVGTGVATVTDNVGDDGTDTLYNIERLQFADQAMFINNALPVGRPAINDTTPTEGQVLSANPGTIQDPNGTTTSVFTYQWEALVGGVWTAIAGATLPTFTPTQAQVDQPLRVVATFTDDQGTVESVVSNPTTVVGDLYVGNGAANVFNGTEGEDIASGLGGADTLNGNGGNDLLFGGNGRDNLNGGDGDDQLNGGGGADTLNGGAGSDALLGGAGNDTYVVTDALDTITELAGQGTDTVLTTLNTFVLPGNVEHLTFNGIGDFIGTGNGLNNRITGGAGNDLLDGGAGVDRLIGGSGDDTYIVDNASDVVVEAAGGGIDTVHASVTDTLAGNVENLLLLGAGNIGGTGNGLANMITGNDGNNTLNGRGGNDSLFGGLGTDTLNGAGGDDTLDGGDGDDVLIGGAGIDTYIGGGGNDTLVGGGGNDFFVFGLNFGDDIITSFDANPGGGQDLLDISALNITSFTFGSSVAIAQNGANTVVAIGGDTITLVGIAQTNVTETDFVLA